MMDQLIERFPNQLKQAIEIGSNSTIRPHGHEIRNIYVAGMGGSGIGAHFASLFTKSELKVPFIIGNSYSAPNFVNKYTLFIASSYSGNTEETLQAFVKVKESGAKFIIISSGGKLIEIAKNNDYDYIELPGGWPSPRACLGFSFVQQLFILYKLKLISERSIKCVANSIEHISANQAKIKERAMEIASSLNGKIPIIYSEEQLEPVTLRFRQQINENAKMLAWHSIFPEMNHNELVGWRDKNEHLAAVFFRTDLEYERNAIRIDITKEVIRKYTNTIVDIYAEGNDEIEKAIYLINLGDWASYFLSQLHGVDSIEIDVIDYLKTELSKV